MSAGQHEEVDIDVLCPHGDTYEPPTDLQFAYDDDDDFGVIFDPDDLLGGWIEADPEIFIDGRWP